MIIYPAIDLRQGRCVRLRQGNPEAETVFSEDPVEMARNWAAKGAQWLHVVNLDGALETKAGAEGQGKLVQRLASPHALPAEPELPVNLRCLEQICSEVDVPVQFGGGLRDMGDIELVFGLGARRVVLGTAAVKNPELVRRSVKRWGSERIVVGIDAREGRVAIHGWQELSDVDAVDLAHHMKCLGVTRVVYTDISRDGTLEGVNVASTSRLGDMTDLKVIASGGVANLCDIRQLKRREHYNVEGVIIGQALYTGQVNLQEAIAVAAAPLRRCSAGILPYRKTDDGVRVLLLWNSFFEQWQFPRGGVQDGETVLDCARRRFHEETNLTAERIHKEVCTTLEYTARIRNYDVERTVVYYLAEVGAGEVELGHENHCEYRWVSLDSAKDMLMETSPEQLPAWESAVNYFASYRGDQPNRAPGSD